MVSDAILHPLLKKKGHLQSSLHKKMVKKLKNLLIKLRRKFSCIFVSHTIIKISSNFPEYSINFIIHPSSSFPTASPIPQPPKKLILDSRAWGAFENHIAFGIHHRQHSKPLETSQLFFGLGRRCFLASWFRFPFWC